MPYEWVSVHEASRRLNRSVSTIRRQIEAGELVGERESIGGRRDRYRVRMPQDASGEASPSKSGDEPPDAPETPHDAPAAMTGLLAIIEADRATVAAQAEQIGALRERVGRAEAARAAAEQRAADLAARLARAERPWWRRWVRPD
jgi:hypothetical protein